MCDPESVERVFAPHGILGRFLNEFEQRIGQSEMAKEILNAYSQNKIALIEAGTGIGKSLAYLVPAVFWALKHQEKTVISTHTIALQEQLIHKDIPFLLKVLDVDLKAVLIKGMRNYLCLRKLDEWTKQKVTSSCVGTQLNDWAQNTQEGSRSEIPFSLSTDVWDAVSCEADNCSHIHCPHYKECFFFKARREAEDAQILVVNHHLLLADINAQIDQKKGLEKSIFPAYQRVIIDEAHHLEQVALDSFTKSVNRIELLRLLAKIFSDAHPERSRIGALRLEILPALHGQSADRLSIIHALDVTIPVQNKECVHLLEKMVAEFFCFLDGVCSKEKTDISDYKLRWMESMKQVAYWTDPLQATIHMLINQIKNLSLSLIGLAKQLDHCFKGTVLQDKIQSHTSELNALSLRLEEKVDALVSFFSEEQDKRVRWLEVTDANLILMNAQLNVSDLLHQHLFSKQRTAILCSATLTTNRMFVFTKQRLGLCFAPSENVVEHIYDSPFDYAKRSLLMIPTDLPDPSDSSFLRAILEPICQSILVSQGNAFVLFTSYEMLKWVYEQLSHHPLCAKYPFLKQGDRSRRVLLEEFKTIDGSVLFATNSFWEGVDVPGEALRCVIIVKLPFQVPSEPIYEAYSEVLKKEGKNPFYDYAVPQAVIKFKQGFGRLMRKKTDRGCIVCLDNRLIKKGYGKLFLNSLPDCKMVVAPLTESLRQMQVHYTQTQKS